MKSVRVRFPPSPTGYCHVGTGRMAVLNYLFAKKHDGTIIFRSEDTDQDRSSREFEEDIIEQLHWLGLSWETFYRTTDMLERHKEAISALVAADKAYVSSEPSKKDPSVIAEVVRLKNPGKTITFADEIRGEITVDTTDLGDFVIGRSIDDPLYHLAVVVDDASDGITHIHSRRRSYFQHAKANFDTRGTRISSSGVRALPTASCERSHQIVQTKG
jgi:glutamyl/glutaminyl-tRNA synthetase